MNRRRFLAGLGLSGAGIGLGALGLGSPLARAGEGQAPCRLLILSHCHGWPYEGWRLRPDGLGSTAPWEVRLTDLAPETLSAPMARLQPHFGRMVALDGLSLATAELDVDGNRHDTGWVHAWTGNNADFSSTNTRAQSASLDQIVAAEIARSDRLPSLELSIDGGLEPGRPISYGANGQQLPRLNTADQAWQRMFGPSLTDATLASRQRSVLDFAYGEYSTLKDRLSSVARTRLEAHFAHLAILGDRIEGMAALSCPSAPENAGTLTAYDARFDAFTELITAAFSCDITRVISLSLGEMPTADFGADAITDDVHKGLAHEIYNDPAKHAAMVDYLTLHAQQVARLLDRLAEMPDVDGRSVLDNTLVVWGSELANGWHGYKDYCATIFGGSWAFDLDRYIRMPHETPIEILVPESDNGGGYSDLAGRPHQHLLVSVARAMGLDTNQIGLDHVQGQTGVRVDCSGPLPELTGRRRSP